MHHQIAAVNVTVPSGAQSAQSALEITYKKWRNFPNHIAERRVKIHRSEGIGPMLTINKYCRDTGAWFCVMDAWEWKDEEEARVQRGLIGWYRFYWSVICDLWAELSPASHRSTDGTEPVTTLIWVVTRFPQWWWVCVPYPFFCCDGESFMLFLRCFSCEAAATVPSAGCKENPRSGRIQGGMAVSEGLEPQYLIYTCEPPPSFILLLLCDRWNLAFMFWFHVQEKEAQGAILS